MLIYIVLQCQFKQNPIPYQLGTYYHTLYHISNSKSESRVFASCNMWHYKCVNYISLSDIGYVLLYDIEEVWTFVQG